jgi:hypothetical protein
LFLNQTKWYQTNNNRPQSVASTYPYLSRGSLPSFQAVYPHLSFTWLKLSVIVLVLRCDHRVVVTLEDWPYNDSKWRDTGRFISGDARSIDAERLRSNDPRSSDRAAQIKRSTFARYNVIGYIPLHYLHTKLLTFTQYNFDASIVMMGCFCFPKTKATLIKIKVKTVKIYTSMSVWAILQSLTFKHENHTITHIAESDLDKSYKKKWR